MTATLCTCIWSVEPFFRLVVDDECPAAVLHARSVDRKEVAS